MLLQKLQTDAQRKRIYCGENYQTFHREESFESLGHGRAIV
jgi:hypothetical protein